MRLMSQVSAAVMMSIMVNHHQSSLAGKLTQYWYGAKKRSFLSHCLFKLTEKPLNTCFFFLARKYILLNGWLDVSVLINLYIKTA